MERETPPKDSPNRPKADKAKAASPAPREDRLKAALKANLARRKAQARARGGKQADQKEQE